MGVVVVSRELLRSCKLVLRVDCKLSVVGETVRHFAIGRRGGSGDLARMSVVDDH